MLEGDQKPTIAIVIAIWNGVKTLQTCLDSLAGQTIRADEIVVMDGASTDGTCMVLKDNTDLLTFWKSEPDKGIYDAWNKALDHVTADWVWFIGCDDYLSDVNVISWWKDQLATLPESTGLIYSKVAMVASNGKVTEEIGQPWKVIERKQSYRMMVPHTGLLARRSLIDDVGKFDPRYRIAGDYDWFMRALRKSDVAFRDKVTICMGDAGLSGAVATQVRTLDEFRTICRNQGRPLPLGWHRAALTVRVKAGASRILSNRMHGLLVDLVRILTLRKPRGAAR
ncbi:glycosyltransferase family 2 protein [Novosphingobium fluoreni]|uniref:glycosyltransferase family 2 protein n=1 Tax=Novosphingobium fluoreni TaxID=1391222 RepID=UPI003DA03A87